MLLLICPVCGNDDFKPLDTAGTILGCRLCTLGIAKELPADPLQVYTRQSYDKARQALPGGANVSVWQRFHHDAAVAVKRFRQMARVLPVVDGRGKVAWNDLGCGNGAFLTVARRMGYKVRGIEADAAFCTEISAITGLPTLPVAEFLRNAISYPAAALSMLDVLEHFFDPIGILRQATECLPKDGVVVLEVPDYSQYELPLDAYPHAKPLEHLFHWNPLALSTLRERHFGEFVEVHRSEPVPGKLQLVWKKKR